MSVTPYQKNQQTVPQKQHNNSPTGESPNNTVKSNLQKIKVYVFIPWFVADLLKKEINSKPKENNKWTSPG